MFCGNLSWELTKDQLADHMAVAGNVIDATIAYYPDGRSKGWGVVEFETPEQAAHAIKTLHDSEINGRLLTCREVSLLRQSRRSHSRDRARARRLHRARHPGWCVSR